MGKSIKRSKSKDKVIRQDQMEVREADAVMLKLFEIIKSNSKHYRDGSYHIGKEITYYDDIHQIIYKEDKIGASEYIYSDGCFYKKSGTGVLKKSKKAILLRYVLDSIQEKSKMSDFDETGVLLKVV